MTTEILRSMLYRGSDVMREVAWVIFDEVHYMRDAERGVVWEETIILLPNKVHYVFLSATIPNSQQFAEWIVHLHNQACHIVSTEYRPTPLKHYIYPVGTPDIQIVVDEQTNFLEANFNKAMSSLKELNPSQRQNGRSNSKFQSHSADKLIQTMMDQKMGPIIVFSFSRKDCEDFAKETARIDLTTRNRLIILIKPLALQTDYNYTNWRLDFI